MIKLPLGLVKTSSAGMQQACSNSGTDAWSEMLPVHLLLCPTEGRPFPSGRCNLTPFASGAAAPAQGSLEGTGGWPGPICLSPCRCSLASCSKGVRASQVAHRGAIWAGWGARWFITCCCKEGWGLLVVKVAGDWLPYLLRHGKRCRERPSSCSSGSCCRAQGRTGDYAGAHTPD